MKKKSVKQIPTILVVDDDPALREMVNHLLKEKFGKNLLILEAENGSSAIELLKNHDISLVISDFEMPLGNGMEIYDYLSRNENPSKLIFFTGTLDLDPAIQTGFCLGVVKKGDFELLVRAVENLFACLHRRD